MERPQGPKSNLGTMRGLANKSAFGERVADIDSFSA